MMHHTHSCYIGQLRYLGSSRDFQDAFLKKVRRRTPCGLCELSCGHVRSDAIFHPYTSFIGTSTQRKQEENYHNRWKWNGCCYVPFLTKKKNEHCLTLDHQNFMNSMEYVYISAFILFSNVFLTNKALQILEKNPSICLIIVIRLRM